ncbi:MAG: hypothetical protein ACR65R_07595 [Methylomicrobium sp.]
MLVTLLDKQRRAASAVKTALLGVGISGRAICINADSWSGNNGPYEKYGVFVSAPPGSNCEPFYETGKTLTEAVRKTIDSIKGKANAAASDDQSEAAPF